MRRAAPWLALAVLLGIVFVSSCDDDDPMAMPVTVELRHDGDNAQAPNLGAATYEAAARFSAAATAPLAGGELTAVMFHVTSLPSSAAVKIYGPGTASTPGALLYSADVGAALVPASWNTHTLTNPVTVIGGDLWISIEFTHVATQKMIGCDPGPAVTDGDWMYISTDSMWIPFGTRFPVSINWNIRGLVEITQ